MSRRAQRTATYLLVVLASLSAAPAGHGQVAPVIQDATLAEPNQRTSEVSTSELRRILADHSAMVLDARPAAEFAVSHIPGARNVAPKPGVSMSMYVSDVVEIDRLTNGDKAAPIVLYCNGPNCGKSKRLADELLTAGYSKVRRYQLGIPVWRALGGVCEIEPDGLRYASTDPTAVFIDTRDPAGFRAGSISGARNLPRSLVLDGKDVGEVKRAKDDARLPMEDHNTRVIVIGLNGAEARFVAEAIAREAFHNVVFFAGTMEQARVALGR